MQEIISKFKFRDQGIVLNAPPIIEKALIQLGFNNQPGPVKSNNTLVFVHDRKDFLNFLNAGLNHIEPDSVLWIAYPKGSSKIKTDINRDSLRIMGEEYGITTVTAISIDETWSALRFRPIDKVGK